MIRFPSFSARYSLTPRRAKRPHAHGVTRPVKQPNNENRPTK